MFKKIEDHEKQTEFATPLLTRKCPELLTWIKQPAKRLQGLENVVQGLLNDLDIENGNLSQLEQVGANLLEPRNNRSIEEYRVILKGKWGALHGAGSPEDLMNLCEMLLSSKRAIWFGFEEYKELINVLFAEVAEKPDFASLPYVLSEMKKAKRGGQAVDVIIMETEDIFLIQEDGRNLEDYNLIPEDDTNSVTLPYSIKEAI
jgi:hypothetical protein